MESYIHGMQWIMFHGLSDFASSPVQRSGSNTKEGDHDYLKSHDPWFSIEKPPHELNGNEIAYGWEPDAYVFTLPLKTRDHTKFNFPFCMVWRGVEFQGPSVIV